ncbi:MAG: murein biosynthesis integral membrane protein MurJ [Rhodopirellula sp.]|nr:murein biosynthesis integral membrane protein MurJ [Rhodopirellula sp.]
MDDSLRDSQEDSQRGRLFQRVRVVGLLTLLSRILGLFRDAVMVASFGNGAIMDAFTVAFRVPNMARQIFGEGALSTAFLPVFIQDMEHKGKQAAFQTATAILAVTTIGLLAMVFIVEASLFGISIFVPMSYEAGLLLNLTAVLTPYLLLICVLAQACAVFHGMHIFGVPALFPVLLNALWIIGAWSLDHSVASAETRIYLIASGIVGIGIVQLGLCIPTLRQIGFRFEWNWAVGRDRVQVVFATMLPVLLGLSITQLNTLCDSLIAWSLTAPTDPTTARWLDSYPLTEGTAAAMYLGQRLYQFPIGVFGVALGTVIYPLLTAHAERGETGLFREDLARGLRMVIAIGIPASVGLVLIATPLTQLIFERGEFTAEDTINTAAMISAYALGAWAACGLLIIARAFYALGDRQTPLRIGLAAVGVNLVANLSLVWIFAGPGLALGTSITATFQVLLAGWLLIHRLEDFPWNSLGRTLLKTMFACAVMSAACLAAATLTPHLDIGSALITKLVGLLLPLTAGATAFLVIARLTGLPEPFDLLQKNDRNS